jgi:hypothetical protein
LVVLERNSPDLLSELTMKIATRFAHPPTQLKFPTTILKDIISLKSNSLVEFEVDTSLNSNCNAHIHEEVPKLEWKRYIEEHWVNSSAGYYAVVGKMSKEEETKLLLEVVAAFSDVHM